MSRFIPFVLAVALAGLVSSCAYDVNEKVTNPEPVYDGWVLEVHTLAGDPAFPVGYVEVFATNPKTSFHQHFITDAGGVQYRVKWDDRPWVDKVLFRAKGTDNTGVELEAFEKTFSPDCDGDDSFSEIVGGIEKTYLICRADIVMKIQGA